MNEKDRLFVLPGSSVKQVTEWYGDHVECRGSVTYVFTPTGIGDVITVICGGCGDEIDVTDFSTW